MYHIEDQSSRGRVGMKSTIGKGKFGNNSQPFIIWRREERIEVGYGE